MLNVNFYNLNNYTPGNESVTLSVGQSVSQLVSATPLKPLNRISWNFVVVKEIICRCAYPQKILILFFFRAVTPFLNLEMWQKWKILLKQFLSAAPLKPLNRILWNFVIVKKISCRCAYPQEILISFLSRSKALFELRQFAKIKHSTEIVCQHNSAETAHHNFVKLCSYEGHNV